MISSQLAALNDLMPSASQAGVTGTFSSVSSIIGLIFSIIIAAAGAIFMIMLIVGGVQYLTGAGNEEATGAAKKRMIDAIIGLIIVLAAWAMGNWVLTKLATGTFGSGGGGGESQQPPTYPPWKEGDSISAGTWYTMEDADAIVFVNECEDKAGFEVTCKAGTKICKCDIPAP